MRTKLNILGIGILAAGMSFSPALFAQENPSNAEPQATNSPSESTGQEMKHSVGNAASDVESGTRHAYHKVGSELKSSDITLKAKTALLRDAETKHSTIHVKTKSGVVTLSGKVDSEQIAEHAQQVVAGIEGVKEVRNNLKY